MLPIGIWVNYDFIPLWATILSIMIYAGLLILSVKNLKKMKSIIESCLDESKSISVLSQQGIL